MKKLPVKKLWRMLRNTYLGNMFSFIWSYDTSLDDHLYLTYTKEMKAPSTFQVSFYALKGKPKIELN